MNESYKKMFKEYVDCYEAIETLSKNDFLSERVKAVIEHDLLHEIMSVIRSELNPGYSLGNHGEIAR